jgi:hypothetical protein
MTSLLRGAWRPLFFDHENGWLPMNLVARFWQHKYDVWSIHVMPAPLNRAQVVVIVDLREQAFPGFFSQDHPQFTSRSCHRHMRMLSSVAEGE